MQRSAWEALRKLHRTHQTEHQARPAGVPDALDRAAQPRAALPQLCAVVFAGLQGIEQPIADGGFVLTMQDQSQRLVSQCGAFIATIRLIRARMGAPVSASSIPKAAAADIPR